VIFLSGWTAVLDAARLVSEEGQETSKLLGLPFWVWQLLNLVLFLAVLLYFVARPLGDAFRKRQLEIERRRQEAEKQRASVERLASDIRERTAKVEREIEEIRKQGRLDGEEARRALAEKAGEEATRIRKDAEEEIDRRVVAARDELRRTAADVAGKTASEILTREITSSDRERILADGVSRLSGGTR
jgi:ATP synthase F0 subunit b